MNRHLIEGMAFKPDRESSVFITTEKEAESKAEQFCRYIESPLLADIEVNFEGMEV
ncbi:MAG: hypothetical protein R3B93_06865 [Bacteroidia bacterium]